MIQLDLEQAKQLRLEVMNTQGQIIERIQLGNSATLNQDLDFSNRANGLYFVRIIAGEEEMTRRIVVAK